MRTQKITLFTVLAALLFAVPVSRADGKDGKQKASVLQKIIATPESNTQEPSEKSDNDEERWRKEAAAKRAAKRLEAAERRKEAAQKDAEKIRAAAEKRRELAKAEAEALKGADGNMSQDLEKQKEEKAEQLQKEQDKGSEKGKEMREKHSRKWWKFWGGSETNQTEAAE